MAIKIVTASEIQNNFEKYMNLLMDGHEIIVTKNGHEVGRFIPKNAAVSYLDRAKSERLIEKYGISLFMRD